jgi:hypothetical protein
MCLSEIVIHPAEPRAGIFCHPPGKKIGGTSLLRLKNSTGGGVKNLKNFEGGRGSDGPRARVRGPAPNHPWREPKKGKLR